MATLELVFGDPHTTDRSCTVTEHNQVVQMVNSGSDGLFT